MNENVWKSVLHKDRKYYLYESQNLLTVGHKSQQFLKIFSEVKS